MIELAAYDVSVNAYSSAVPTSTTRRHSGPLVGPGTSR